MNNNTTHHTRLSVVENFKAMGKGTLTITVERNGDNLDITAEQNMPDEYLMCALVMNLDMVSNYIAQLKGCSPERACEVMLSEVLLGFKEAKEKLRF